MTRYTRLGKPTHQRVAGESTTWDELKSTPHKDKNSRKKGRETPKTHFQLQQGRMSNGNGGKDWKNNRRLGREEEVSSNFTELGVRNAEADVSSDGRMQNTNVKGYGESKTVKIFGQFWVPLQDARRLQGLVKKLRGEGLSRREIQQALQNERRRAEKAGKRIRDKTCFGCRQFGHVLSDCPKASATSSQNVDGSLIEQESRGDICFKCGSTEHTSRQCKRKGDKFNFAKCFICSNVGHISRQCPKNTKGIYPSGGECNVCGELTHLAKDCPSAFGKPGTDESRTSTVDIGEPVMSKVSNPFASTEYEPEMSFGSITPTPSKKRRVKY